MQCAVFIGEMSVEAKVFCSQTRNLLREYSSLTPGEGTFINPFDDAIVSVKCENDDGCGELVVDPLKREFIGVAIFRHPGKLAYQMDINEPVYFANGDIAVVYSSGCTQEIYVQHIPGGDIPRLKTLQREAASRKKAAKDKTPVSLS